MEEFDGDCLELSTEDIQVLDNCHTPDPVGIADIDGHAHFELLDLGLVFKLLVLSEPALEGLELPRILQPNVVVYDIVEADVVVELVLPEPGIADGTLADEEQVLTDAALAEDVLALRLSGVAQVVPAVLAVENDALDLLLERVKTHFS